MYVSIRDTAGARRGLFWGLVALWAITFTENIYYLFYFNALPKFAALLVCAVFYFYVYTGKGFARHLFVASGVVDVLLTVVMLFLMFRPRPAMAISLWKFNAPLRVLFFLFVLLKTVLSVRLVWNPTYKAFLAEQAHGHPEMWDGSLAVLVGVVGVVLVATYVVVKVFFYY